MSVILPYQYKHLADKLGEMYAKIRDSIFKEGDSTAVYNVAQATLSQQSDGPTYSVGGIYAESDATTWGCVAAGSGESEDPDNENYSVWTGNADSYTAPPGSVGGDLGNFWFRMINTTFSDESAKRLATNQLSAALSRLNTHIVTRMGQGPDGTAITNISQYYSQYAFVSDSATEAVGMTASQLSLFDLGSESGLDSTSTYFTQDFAELSARVGVTIDSSYVE